MKPLKMLLSVLVSLTLTSVPISSKASNNIDPTTPEVIQISEDGFKDVDYLNGASKEIGNPQIPPMPRTPGDLLSEAFYVFVGARTSVRIGVYLSEFYADTFKIEWDGATDYNPEMDIVFEDINTGKQLSLYDTYGILISENRGHVYFDANFTGYFRVWFRSLNYSDVTFYRVSVFDA